MKVSRCASNTQCMQGGVSTPVQRAGESGLSGSLHKKTQHGWPVIPATSTCSMSSKTTLSIASSRLRSMLEFWYTTYFCIPCDSTVVEVVYFHVCSARYAKDPSHQLCFFTSEPSSKRVFRMFACVLAVPRPVRLDDPFATP